MKLLIKTDAKNIENFIKKNKLYLEGTTEKWCRVEGNPDAIKALKGDLDRAEYTYFDHTEYNVPSTKKSIKDTKKK